jgi:hypothetical protein
MAEYVGDDEELLLRREAESPTVLREYWREAGWEPFSPEEFYVTWGGLWWYAWRLAVCVVRGHQWHDSHYCLYGEPGRNRHCERCWRSEILRVKEPPAS